MKTPLPHKHTWLILFAIVLCTFQSSPAHTLDPTFQSPVLTANANSTVVKALPDGNVYVAGNMDLLGTTTVPRVTRLKVDGSLDRTFNSALPDTDIKGIELMRGGSLLVYSSSHMYILKRDGKLLNSVYVGNIGSVAITLTNDIYVSGYGYVYKYDANFVRDGEYTVTTDGWVNDIALQGSKLIIAGDFTNVLG